MSTFRYLQLDVFPASRGGGNPLGVVVDARDWRNRDMQAFAHWTNLVETTFLLPPEAAGADYRLRIFTPTSEIPFAGHPTIGSAHAALESGFVRARDGLLTQECGAGLLPIRIEGAGASRELFVRAPAAHVVQTGAARGSLLSRLIAGRVAADSPPALVEGGRRWWVAEFGDEAAVRNWRPDHDAIRAVALADNCLGVCVFARCTDAECDLVVRAFPAGVGIVEDPASGAANGLIAAWIAARGFGGTLARGYRVSQGREIGHDARISVRIDEDKSVWVGGRTDLIADGAVHWQSI
jgi:PhzF family phenazine biosynthesis protein